MNFVPKDSVNNIAALVQMMAWRRPRGQAIVWANDGQFIDAYMCHSTSKN